MLAEKYIWDEDLNAVPGLTDLLASYLGKIAAKGMRAAVEEIL